MAQAQKGRSRPEPAQLPNGDVVRILLEQHARINELFGRLRNTSGRSKQQLFDELRRLLTVHEAAEEMIVRPVTRAASGGHRVASARNAEEGKATHLLANLERLGPSSPGVPGRIRRAGDGRRPACPARGERGVSADRRDAQRAAACLDGHGGADGGDPGADAPACHRRGINHCPVRSRADRLPARPWPRCREKGPGRLTAAVSPAYPWVRQRRAGAGGIQGTLGEEVADIAVAAGLAAPPLRPKAGRAGRGASFCS
jgi:Hemerythrin HHE cation binding domain